MICKKGIRGGKMTKPVINKVRCKKCNEVIESKHRHDFKSCKCGAIFIDGGTDYQRYGWVRDQSKLKDRPPAEEYIDFSLSLYE